MITSTSPQGSGLHRRAASWSTLALLSLPIVIAAWHDVGALDRAIGDSAIIQLQVDDMPGRLPLVGVYSRFGFHHPGPMLYYVVAAPVHLLGASGLAIAGALVAIASLGGILLVLYRRGGSVLFALGVVLDLVLVRSMALDVLSAWNPYILILPFALAILLTWSVWCSDWRALPWLAFVGSFVVQAHIGTAPTIALMFLSAAVWTTIARVRRRCPTRPVVLAIVVLAVVWLPPLIEQFTHQPGNISQILSIGSGGSGEPTLGLTDALHLLSHLLGRTNPLTVASTAPIELITAARTTPILLLMVPATALALSAFLARRLRLDDALRLTGLLFGLCLTSLVFLTSISGLPYLYLVRWIIVITCFVWMDLIWILIAMVRTRITVRPSVLASIGCSAVALLAIGLIPLGPSAVHSENLVGAEAIRFLEGRIDDAIAGCGLIEVRSTSDQPVTGPALASGVIAELHRRGRNAVIEDLFEFSHGAEHSLHGRSPDCTLTLTISSAADLTSVPTADGERVAAFDTLNRRERIQYQRLSHKRDAGPLDDRDRAELRRLRAAALSVRGTIVHHD